MKRLMGVLSCSLLSWAAACAAMAGTPAGAGRLIHSAPLAAAHSVPGAGRALAIRYLATDGISGEGTIPVTGEVIYPAGPAPKGGWPIVAWAHGTVGIAGTCAPSLHPHSSRDQTYLHAWLQRGFVIVATDYQGLGGPGIHAYLNTRVEAYSVLDAVRAALTGLPDLRNQVLIVGQSQGGGAAFAATAWAPEYAPTLHIAGTVATGIPFMAPAVIRGLFQQLRAGTAPATAGSDPVVAYVLLIGAAEAGLDPGFDPTKVFTPKAMHALQQAGQLCLGSLEEVVKADGLTPANAFVDQAPAALEPVLQRLAYPSLKLKTPLFIGTGLADRDVSPLGQIALAKAACQAGTRVQLHRYPGKDHSQTVLASLPDSEVFTREVMSGQPPSSNCAELATP